MVEESRRKRATPIIARLSTDPVLLYQWYCTVWQPIVWRVSFDMDFPWTPRKGSQAKPKMKPVHESKCNLCLCSA